MMTRKEIFDKFKFAIENEYETYRLYADIAQQTDDTVVKNMFHEIAQDELEHRTRIMNLYNKMQKEREV